MPICICQMHLLMRMNSIFFFVLFIILYARISQIHDNLVFQYRHINSHRKKKTLYKINKNHSTNFQNDHNNLVYDGMSKIYSVDTRPKINTFFIFCNTIFRTYTQ